MGYNICACRMFIRSEYRRNWKRQSGCYFFSPFHLSSAAVWKFHEMWSFLQANHKALYHRIIILTRFPLGVIVKVEVLKNNHICCCFSCACGCRDNITSDNILHIDQIIAKSWYCGQRVWRNVATWQRWWWRTSLWWRCGGGAVVFICHPTDS